MRTLAAFVSLMLAIIVLRLFYLQVVGHDTYARFAVDNQLQRERVPSPRGYLKDRSGRILVDNVLHFEVVMSWRQRADVELAASRLAAWLPIDTARVMSRFDAWERKNGRRAFPIVPDADKFMISFVRENVDALPGLRVVSRSRRRYRESSLAAHMIGYVGEASDEDVTKAVTKRYYPGDMIGKTALELRCEDDLRGVDGQRVLEVNASGRVLGEVKELSTAPVPGDHVHLTIDAGLQEEVEQLLADLGPSAAVVMDVSDGSILAAASSPAYDPNQFATGISQVSLNTLFNAENKPLFNRVSQARYPPASTFKVISAYAILSNQLVDPNEILVYCVGSHQYGNRVFRCWNAAGHGAMNLMSAIIQSCDVYFYEVGEIMDADMLAAAARDFGLGSRTGLDASGEVAGLVPDREYYDRKYGKGRWTQGYMLNNIIGQGEYLASVLQVARMCAAIANGGYLVVPHLIDHVQGQPPIAYTGKRVPELRGRTLAFLRRAMEGVVADEDGTSRWTRLDWLDTAGKTGTAENSHGEPHAWYMAYAPAEDPIIAVAVIVENAGHGGDVAAPVVRDLFASYFGPPPESAAAEVPAASVSNSATAPPVVEATP